MGGQYTIFTLKLIKEHGADWFERKLNDSRQIIKLYRADYEKLIEYQKQQYGQTFSLLKTKQKEFLP